MNLYQNAEVNIRKTWIYLTGFFLFLIALGWIFAAYVQSPGILWFAVLLSVVMSVGSYWYSDKIALSMSGARAVTMEEEPELYRIVENLCMTAGLPIPAVYLINDPQPNAFATGRDARHAAIAVTSGLLGRLERAELEGVVAHELSHIGNRDILLSTIVVVLVGAVAILSNFFFRITLWGPRRSGGRNEDRGGLDILLIVLAVVAAILAPIAANLLKLAISRKREFLADASGALLTRYPEGLARALEKIDTYPRQLASASNATAHLYIANPFRGEAAANWVAKLYMTHPPVEERVAALRGMRV